MDSLKYLGIVVLSFVSAVSSVSPSSADPSTDNWKVGNCILANFSMEITIFPNNTNKNSSSIVSLPYSAKVLDSLNPENCGNTTQTLKLNWFDTAQNGSQLERNLTVIFQKNTTYYGIGRIYGSFVLGYWNETKIVVNTTTNKTHNVNVSHVTMLEMDSNDMKNNLMLKTPLERSFLCADIGAVSFSSQVVIDRKPPFNDVRNSTVHGKSVKFDAFRGTNINPDVMQTAQNCDYQPNDIIPIVVGCSLAALVVFILVSYLFGRRRARQRGYQSV